MSKGASLAFFKKNFFFTGKYFRSVQVRVGTRASRPYGHEVRFLFHADVATRERDKCRYEANALLTCRFAVF